MYTTMANYLARILHIRPSEILDTWGVPELIVTYGNYANEQAQRHLDEWNSLDTKTRLKTPRPPEYAVKFLGVL